MSDIEMLRQLTPIKMAYNAPYPPSFTSQRMTFDEASKLIKKGDIIQLRQQLQEGLSPNLANQYSWTLLMIAALEGNTSTGVLSVIGMSQQCPTSMHGLASSWT